MPEGSSRVFRQVGHHLFGCPSDIKNGVRIWIPGWATDNRIFDYMGRGGEGVRVDSVWPVSFCQDLLLFLQYEGLSQVQLTGFSLGGFLALDFVEAHRHLVSAVHVIGLRASYPSAELSMVRRAFKAKGRTYLSEFYRLGMAQTESEPSWAAAYSEKFAQMPELLLEGLAYLGQAQVSHDRLLKMGPLTLTHGRLDRIAPWSDWMDWHPGIGQSVELVPEGGHFLL